MTEAFRDNEELLSAIFSEKAKCPGDSYPMLPKNEFVNLLFEAGLLVLPKRGKPDDKKGAAAKDDKNAAPPEQEVIYEKNEVLMSIMHIGTFDMDYLDYFNFLEAIVKVAHDRPWTEDGGDSTPMVSKIQFMLSTFENHYSAYIQNYRIQTEKFNNKNKYQPQVVKALEDPAGSDEDDE